MIDLWLAMLGPATCFALAALCWRYHQMAERERVESWLKDHDDAWERIHDGK